MGPPPATTRSRGGNGDVNARKFHLLLQILRKQPIINLFLINFERAAFLFIFMVLFMLGSCCAFSEGVSQGVFEIVLNLSWFGCEKAEGDVMNLHMYHLYCIKICEFYAITGPVYII